MDDGLRAPKMGCRHMAVYSNVGAVKLLTHPGIANKAPTALLFLSLEEFLGYG